MNLKLVAAMTATLLIAACSTPPGETASVAGDGAFDEANGQQVGQQVDRQVAVGEVRPGSEEDFVVNVGDRVFFGFDRFDVDQEAQRTLRQQAEWLSRYPNIAVVIEGHTDERGTREYNLALGERRANSVRNFLISQGVSSDRLRTVSFGKERPAMLGSNENAWERNRRAVTVVN